MILDVRARVTEQFGLPAAKRWAIARWTDPASGARLAGIGARAASVVSDGERVIRRVPFARDLTRDRSLVAPASRPLRARIRRDEHVASACLPSSRTAGRRVAFFPGCLTDRVLPEMGEAVVRVLRACGCDVHFPVDQHCCGLVALNVGDRKHGRAMAEQTIRMLEGVEADYVLTNSTSCLAAIAQDYQHLFRDDDGWQRRAARQGERLIDFTTFMDEVARVDPADFPRDPAGPSVTIHDACQSANALGLGTGLRRIVGATLGLELREMRDSRVCCGFGGSFSVDYPRVSTAILRKKLGNAAGTSAGVIVSDNPGCLMQLRGGLTASGSPMRALHIAELIAERLPSP
jgi:Fe-S oxidoreductase